MGAQGGSVPGIVIIANSGEGMALEFSVTGGTGTDVSGHDIIITPSFDAGTGVLTLVIGLTGA
jgi:hypothetical protein